MAEIHGKIYKDIKVNSQFVIQITSEHIKEYLELKGVSLPCDVRIGTHDAETGQYSDLDPETPILVTCATYEQSQTTENL